MRVLVCGGRDFEDQDLLDRTLDRINEERGISTIIHGLARGADRMGGEYARVHAIPVLEFPADWGKYGRKAGYVRNARMLKEGQPELVVAFPGGKGTMNMVNQAIDAHIGVYVVGKPRMPLEAPTEACGEFK